MIYQIQTKFRDEPRSRGGLIRVREFTMKDAYSFHTSQADLEQYYQRVYDAYHTIYRRAGLRHVLAIKSDTGMMGGNVAHEYMYLSDGGEDSIVTCPQCDYCANMEVATSVIDRHEVAEAELKEVYTPHTSDIEALCEFLGLPAYRTMKAIVYLRADNEKPLVVFVRGDLQVNETKLKKVVQTEVYPFNDYDSCDLCFGFIGGVGLSGVDIVYDKSLENMNNMVCGANKPDHHLTGVSVKRDIGDLEFYDVAKVEPGDRCPVCGAPLNVGRGIEVGNIFQLGTKYSASMGMTYADENGELQTPIMGCYGIGVGRLLACIIEDNHDQYGPIWPKSVAPWDIHICVLNPGVPQVKEAGDKLYAALSANHDVVMDDRGLSAGVQFADADLLGLPVRIIVGKKNIANGCVEVVTRDKNYSQLLPIEQVESAVAELLK